ncbi:MAG: hypothetical protein ACRDYY_16540 [Acidimicrobiales bacterium]
MTKPDAIKRDEEDEEDEDGTIVQRLVAAPFHSMSHALGGQNRSEKSGVSRASLTVQRKIEMPAWFKKWQQKRKQKKEKADLPYNVAPGEKLPTLHHAVSERFKDVRKFDEEAVTDQTAKEVGPAACEIAEDDSALIAMYEAVKDDMTKSLQATKNFVPFPDASAWVQFVQPRLGDALAKMKPEDEFKLVTDHAKQSMMILPKDVFDKRALPRFMSLFETAAEERAKNRGRLRAPKRGEGIYDVVPSSSPEDAFVEEHSTTKLAHASVPDSDRPGFAAALKKLPTVATLLQPSGAKGVQPTGGGIQKGGWKDGGDLLGKVKEVNDLVGVKKHLASKRFKSKSLRAKIVQAESAVKTVVDPQLLAQVRRPEINVHATAAMSFTAPWGYRANANTGYINIAYNEDMDVISHELGHAVENYLPMAAFYDVHLLLAERHRAAGGGEEAVSSASVFTPKEGRFAGKYVTGKYTSTVYRDQSNEVISQAMQFFSTPENARKLVEKDPQHAAIVLRMMRPQDYVATRELRPYDKYLPQKTGPSMLDRYAEAQRKTDALFGVR